MALRYIAVAALALAAACGEEERLFNTFEPPPPVEEVPCPGTEQMSPWIEEMVPVDEGLGGIWGTSATNIWVVGALTTILHYDGRVWREETLPDGRDLYAIHGVAPNDIWAVGRGGIAIHWDGFVWSEIPSGTDKVLVGVWAVAPDEVWMIGDDGVRKWNGTRIGVEPGWPSGAMNSVWAASRTEVWIVGDREIYLFDGEVFQTQPIANAGTLASVWGTDSEHVWTIGHNSMNRPGFAQLEGGDWFFSAAPPRAVYFSLWTLSSDELWAGANDTTIFYRKDGKWCREHLAGLGAVNSFFGASATSDIWAVGAKREAGGVQKPVMLRRRR